MNVVTAMKGSLVNKRLWITSRCAMSDICLDSNNMFMFQMHGSIGQH